MPVIVADLFSRPASGKKVTEYENKKASLAGRLDFFPQPFS
jgi:hypothetical protein